MEDAKPRSRGVGFGLNGFQFVENRLRRLRNERRMPDTPKLNGECFSLDLTGNTTILLC